MAPLMIFPRLARALHHPTLAAVLGAILIIAGAIGLATGDMPVGWAILTVVVGMVNLLRGVVPDEARASSEAPHRERD